MVGGRKRDLLHRRRRTRPLTSANASAAGTTSTRSTRTSGRVSCGACRWRRAPRRPSRPGPSSVLSYRLSRDGSLIVVERGPTPLEDDRHRAELWVMDAGGGNAREVTHNDIEEAQPELSPDNSRILFLAETNEKLEPYYNSNALRDAGGGRDTETRAARLSVRDRPGRLVARRLVDPGRRQHGRAQRDHRDRRVHAAMEAAHQRRPLHPADVERRGAGRPDGVPVRRAGAVWGRVDAGDSGHANRRRGRSRARHRGVRRARADVRAAAPGEGGVEGRRRHDRSKACSSIRPTMSPAGGIPSSCRCTAGRAIRTSSARARGCSSVTFPS